MAAGSNHRLPDDEASPLAGFMGRLKIQVSVGVPISSPHTENVPVFPDFLKAVAGLPQVPQAANSIPGHPRGQCPSPHPGASHYRNLYPPAMDRLSPDGLRFILTRLSRSS